MTVQRTLPKLATSTPKTSPTSISFEILGVPPNWLNWSRGLKERIALRMAWRDCVWLAAKVARNMARWEAPRATAKRHVAIRCYRVRELDDDGLHASVKPVIDGLKWVQYVTMNKHKVKIEGAGLIYDDSPLFITQTVEQFHVEHYSQERTEVEVSRVV